MIQERQLLWVSAHGPQGKESASNRIRKLSDGLRAGGVEVHWIHPQNTLGDPFRSASLPIKALRVARALWRLEKEVACWLRKHPTGVAVFSVPPASILLLAGFFAGRFPGRVVLDFRDPVVNPKLNPRPEWVDSILLAAQSRVFRNAAIQFLSSPGIRSFLPLGTPSRVILSGFDPSESVQPVQKFENSSKNPNSPLRIVYGGTFYGSRSPMSLIQSIGRNATTSRFHFDFYCEFGNARERTEIEEAIQRASVQDQVRLHPMVGRTQFMEISAAADALLMITHSQGSEYAIPGKLFDYLSCGKPLLIQSDDEALRTLLEESQISATFLPIQLNQLEVWWRDNSPLLEEKLRSAGLHSSAPPASLSSTEQAKIFIEALFKTENK